MERAREAAGQQRTRHRIRRLLFGDLLRGEVGAVPEVGVVVGRVAGQHGALQNRERGGVDNAVTTGQAQAQHIDRRAGGPVHEVAAETSAVAGAAGGGADAFEVPQGHVADVFIATVIGVAALGVEVADVLVGGRVTGVNVGGCTDVLRTDGWELHRQRQRERGLGAGTLRVEWLGGQGYCRRQRRGGLRPHDCQARGTQCGQHHPAGQRVGCELSEQLHGATSPSFLNTICVTTCTSRRGPKPMAVTRYIV